MARTHGVLKTHGVFIWALSLASHVKQSKYEVVKNNSRISGQPNHLTKQNIY